MKDEDLKFLGKVMRCHSNRKAVVELSKSSPDLESPQQDSFGRARKLVSIQLRAGLTANLYVCKMECADPLDQSTSLEKRFAQVEELFNKSKKQKTDTVITEELVEPKTNSDQCAHHVK
ncbi:uncharacterized protein LOC122084356 [Macadamia integrifolia]|uniref:uncharacterized protein LOC122084356 n=1 Tax=Macadamia integrifolia TaxID=60698 RepID=UPI001C4E9AA8|nr:uncharacterized protein LOC122084356 [Macadamia integrifolia]XP_042508472.1 uncharacterized protein LOC122084356 [Macadamia integrifolia]